MQPVLKFVTTHWVSLASGVGAVAFIVIAVIGMTSDAVPKKMQEELTRTKATTIRSLMSTPVNETVIAAEIARGEQLTQEFARTQEVVKQINRRAPLMPGIFPKPATLVAPLQFRENYVKVVADLPRSLAADTLPTASDIQEEQRNVEDLIAQEREKLEEEQADDLAGAGPRPPVRTGAGRAPPSFDDPDDRFGGVVMGGGGGGGVVMGGGGGRMARGGGARGGAMMPGPQQTFTAPTTDPKYDPIYRARVTKARSIHCYIDPQTFQVSPIARETTPPSVEEMWNAQVSVWIQEDVVRAIAGLNGQAAEKLDRNDIALEHVPVKRLVAVRVLGYELPNGQRVAFRVDPGVGAGPFQAPPVGSTLTGRVTGGDIDVVRFMVQLVVDQRQIPRVIDAISRANFFQCVGVSYEAVNRQTEEMQLGYFYGTAPVVKLTLDFEAYMAVEAYADLMPPEVRARLGGGAADGG